jgi:hypothetical protein
MTYQKHKIINSIPIYLFTEERGVYSRLGITLVTCLIGLTSVPINPAGAVENVVSEQREKMTSAHNLEASSSLSDTTQQPNISLRQRLLTYKKNLSPARREALNSGATLVGKGVRGLGFPLAFPHDVKSQKKRRTNLSSVTDSSAATHNSEFSAALTSEKFATGAKSGLEANLGEKLLASQDGDRKLRSQKQTKAKNPDRIIAQTDSSEFVGDTLGDINKLRQELLIDPIVTLGEFSSSSPGSTAGTPSAYGASFGQAYIGGGLGFPLDSGKDRVDGSLSVGFGLGDAVKTVGLEVNVNITSVGGGNTFDFGDSGGVGLKLHKYFTDGTAVAVGWSNAIKWGDSTQDQDTIYGVVTRSFPLEPDSPNNKLPLTMSVGLGSGSFRSKGAINARDNSVNIFGSLGLRVIPEVSLVGSWTGNRLNMGASFAPLKKVPVVINTVFTDVTGNFQTGLGFTLSAGYSFQF